MRLLLYVLTICLLSGRLSAQNLTPEISSWIINPGNETGYNGIPSNILQVQYSDNNVYISCNSIPGYDIGPWPGNPNTPAAKNFVFKITRHPQPNTGNQTAIGLGHTGVWTNGVSIFNADDGMTYNNQGVWHRNAAYWEGSSFDDCLGHPAPGGEYHHHVSPVCLYDVSEENIHSPLIGFAFDGYPVYGAYAFANPDGTGGIKRMATSYRKRNITTRTTLPDGSTATQPGPPVGNAYPLGAFIQDYEYVPGLGDLDAHNGRFCVTPEYPQGTYAYFATIAVDATPAFPYTMFGTYYGVVQQGNTGPNSGHVAINEPTLPYTGTSGTAEAENGIFFELAPNPTADMVYLYIDQNSRNNSSAALFDLQGKLLLEQENLQPTVSYGFDLSAYPAGIYLMRLQNGSTRRFCKIVKL